MGLPFPRRCCSVIQCFKTREGGGLPFPCKALVAGRASIKGGDTSLLKTTVGPGLRYHKGKQFDSSGHSVTSVQTAIPTSDWVSSLAWLGVILIAREVPGHCQCNH